jgi:tRNA-dihydrouridine synthase B
VQALTIHGRTRAQMYTGEADWTLIGEVKNTPGITMPIIGNGDVDSPQKAKQMFEEYGVDAIMVGRASIGHPWIFKEIKHFLLTGEELPPMTLAQQVQELKEYMNKSVEVKGLPQGVIHMRRQFAKGFKGLDNFRDTRIKLLTRTDYDETLALLDEIVAKWGE